MRFFKTQPITAGCLSSLGFWFVFGCSVNWKAWGQTYGNEWINYDQVYFKCPVVARGIHRISYSTLQNSGFPLNTDPRKLQMFARGQEIPIYVAGEADGLWDPGDYILFYGEPNDGRLDSALYLSPDDHATPGLSLFCDTIYYFITISNSTNNLRYIPESDNNFSAYATAPYYLAVIKESFSSDYHSGQVLQFNIREPVYNRGEGYATILNGAQFFTHGWTGVWSGYENTIFSGGPPASFRVHIAGANDPPDASPLDHRYFVTFGSAQKDTSIETYGLARIKLTAPAASVANAGFAYKIHFSPFYSMSTRNALLYAEATLPQTYNLSGRQEQYMEVPNNPAGSKYHLSITNFNTNGSAPWLFDLSNRRMVMVYTVPGGYSALLPNGPQALKSCYLTSESRFLEVPIVRPVRVKGFAEGRFRNFGGEYKNFNYIVLTSESLWEAAEPYTDYRRLTGWKALTVDFEELTDQFGWGIPGHPQAVRNFLRYALNTWTTKPELLFIIGKGYYPEAVRWNSALWSQNFVPTLGSP
ncbi:MAG: C25 family cysteine peptidase, partial [Flavobacteriales bacterium]|nr:C25 family cysteine peptidase [Flavobacteriales bacterium]MDW8410856.1 C25 family cysteine peptidase [Flavobacteriales bacterium]